MGKIILFRASLVGDDETTLDRIDFNNFNPSDSKNTKIENAFITSFKRTPSDGIGNNQGAETDLGDHQALGPVESIYEISGFISKRDGNNGNGANLLLIKLDQWSEASKVVDGVFNEGRFGIVVNDNLNSNLLPTNLIGLLWESITYETDFGRNQEKFTIRFKVSKGDGT